MLLKEIKKLAKDKGWEFHDYQENIGMINFVKVLNSDLSRINIYTTKMTVATCINHPRKVKTQLFRKHVDRKLLIKILENPRVHTHKGYRTKA